MATTTEHQGPGPVAAPAGCRDNGLMVLTPAERKRIQRARQKAGEILPTCSSCGAQLQPTLRQRPDRLASGLCWPCWIESPAGLEAERLRGAARRGADPERARLLARERARRFRQRVREQQGQGAEAAGATQDGQAQG